MTSQETRSRFLEYFENKAHSIVPSAPLVMKNDPTLMFTNAGMNQFKEFFLGNSTAKDKRVADVQKCLRVSGKHNDLEEVGKDTYHHTMFEMLGNWSFGDYFKKEAIEWAWQLLTEVYGIDPNNLYVTIFEGDATEGLAKDVEAENHWKTLIPEDRILLGNKKDNFWEMGAQGPCGPCSEIHVDIRPEAEKAKIDGATLVNQDHPLVVEIWNLVFMQFNRKADGSLEDLPEKHIDTGMGFERLCMVLQNKFSNYDTDVFTPLIAKVEALSGKKYGNNVEVDIAIRVTVDHIRAAAFAVADGQLPSNTGAGYVIRRILRRAIRYGFTFLGLKEPFLHELLDTLANQMGTFYPELEKQRKFVARVIKEEEISFLATLEQGLKLLNGLVDEMEGKVLDGAKAFELYDTFGFPIDLTELILSEKGLKLDHDGFKKALAQQKERSKKASEVNKEDWVLVNGNGNPSFTGYDSLSEETSIIKYRQATSKKDGSFYEIVLEKTPFYPEGGGQVGDRGTLFDVEGNKTAVYDTKRINNEIVHFAKNLPKNVEGGIKAEVDPKKRSLAERNHTATHLLHQALRQVLGDHVEQKGSMVSDQYLRFDFSHFSKVTNEELAEVESLVNQRITESLPLEENREVSMQDALDQGAMALFGEKYGDTVRTIRFGSSIELCGGTHVKGTAEIWGFKIAAESAVAAGIRRIEAITSEAVKRSYESSEKELVQIKNLLKQTKEPVKAVNKLINENTQLKKQIEALLREKAKSVGSQLENSIETVNGACLLVQKVDLEPANIKDLLFSLGEKHQNLFALLGSSTENKAMLFCYISKELVKEKDLNAGKVVRELGQYIKGGGGGQPFYATAGGKDPNGLAQALENARDYLLG